MKRSPVMAETPEPARAATLRLSWRHLALMSLLFNLTAIVTVATVASVTDAGALNTVALALSIVAFISQLIMYSVQSWQSGEQLRQARELNGQTQAILSEVRTRIEGTQQMVSVQHQELLHLATLKASSALRKEAADSPDRRVEASSVARAFDDAAALTHGAISPQVPMQDASIPNWRGRVAWPAPGIDVDAVVEALDGHDVDLESFVISLIDDVSTDGTIVRPGLFHQEGADAAMRDRGLLQVQPGGEREIVCLTEQGRLAGRLLLAPWPPPVPLSHLTERLRRLRGRIPPDSARELTLELELRELTWREPNSSAAEAGRRLP